MLSFFDRLKLTPSERRLVVIIATVAVVVLNYWLVWPRFSDFRTISDDIASMQRRKAAFELEIGRRPTYEALLRKLQTSGSALPAGEERIQFRSTLERLAREVGLAVPRWGEVLPERGGGATNAFFESISLTMSQVTGTEEQFVEFLYRVGTSNSTVRVKDLTLAPGNFDPRAQGKTNLVGTIKLVASVQKAVAKPATGAGPAEAGGPTASAASPSPSPGATVAPASRPPGASPAGQPRTNTIPAPSRPAPRTNPAPVPTVPAPRGS